MANSSELFDDLWLDGRLAALQPAWQPDTRLGLALLRGRCSQARRERRWTWALAAVMVVTVTVALVALPAPRVLAHRCIDCSVALLQSLTTAPPAPSQLKPQAQRTTAPDFTLNDAAGHSISLSALKGQVVLLNFWATWCHGCQTEIPWFVEFQKKYGDAGLTIIGVSLDGDGWKSVTPFLEQRQVNYPIVIGTDELSNIYNAAALPVTVLIDRDGKIAARHEGVVNRATTEADIQTLLGEASMRESME